MKYIVYKITNNVNGMIYIGVTSRDFSTYHGSGSALLKAYKKFGRNNFTKEILYSFDNKSDMLLKEAEIVNAEFISRNDTYNIIIGGGDLNTKGFVSIIDENGNGKLIKQEDFTKESSTYTSNKVTVKDFSSPTGHIQITKDEFNNGDYFGCNKNKVRIIDDNSLTGYSSISSDEFAKGDYKSWNSKMTSAILRSTGKPLHVSIDDARWDTKELVGVNTGRIRIYKPYTYLKTKLVYNDELQQYINNGWCRGTGLTWLNKDGKRKMVNHYDIDTHLNNGWKQGK